jgi:hypothetical protein
MTVFATHSYCRRGLQVLRILAEQGASTMVIDGDVSWLPHSDVYVVYESPGSYKGHYLRHVTEEDVDARGFRIPAWAKGVPLERHVAINARARPAPQAWTSFTRAVRQMYNRILVASRGHQTRQAA